MSQPFQDAAMILGLMPGDSPVELGDALFIVDLFVLALFVFGVFVEEFVFGLGRLLRSIEAVATVANVRSWWSNRSSRAGTSFLRHIRRV